VAALSRLGPAPPAGNRKAARWVRVLEQGHRASSEPRNRAAHLKTTNQFKARRVRVFCFWCTVEEGSAIFPMKDVTKNVLPAKEPA
jgi:hypothetical protein